MRSRSLLPIIVVGLALAVVVALFSPLASSHPDGLERVAEDNEFSHKAKDPPYKVIADYVFPGVENEQVATILSGLVGIAIVAGVGFGLVFAMRTLGGGKSTSDNQQPPPNAQKT